MHRLEATVLLTIYLSSELVLIDTKRSIGQVSLAGVSADRFLSLIHASEEQDSILFAVGLKLVRIQDEPWMLKEERCSTCFGPSG
jgi:hypothetical protein